MVVMKIVGLMVGGTSAFDGKYLMEYDPEREGVSPDGLPMLAHIAVTRDPADAMVWERGSEALEEWRRVSERWPLRRDGRPNRPLSAFTVEVLARELARGV